MDPEQNLDQFARSWQNAKNYPLNLILQGCKFGALRAHKRLLDATALDLFNPRSKVVAIDLDEARGKRGGSVLVVMERDYS
jgi:hypothetical protein